MFDTNELTTLQTIAEHEKEINEQAGYTQLWGLIGGLVDDTADITVELTPEADSVIYTTSNGSKVPDAGIIANIWTLPANAQILEFSTLDSQGKLIDTYKLGEQGERQGVNIRGSSTVVKLSHESAWQLIEVDRTWQDKINLAKTLLVNDIESALSERGYKTNELGGVALIDIVTNAGTFRIANDYLALNLIYRDLSNAGFSELFRRKAVQYSSLYDAEFSRSLKRMQLDPCLTGSPTENRPEFSARVHR